MGKSTPAARFTGGYWKDWEDTIRDVTIDAVYDRFEESGRIRAFQCGWKEGDPQKPHIYWDSDVAKWIEGASYLIGKGERQDLVSKIESIIDDIEANQLSDGYFNSYFITVEPGNRFKGRTEHELYCAGHLIEAAVAYYEATGRDRFLKIMEKYADLIYKVFVTDASAAFVAPGHEEIELALFKLYKVTGKRAYFDLAAHFINIRGTEKDLAAGGDANSQSHRPVREQAEAIGHSVRAMYLYAGIADLTAESGEEELLNVCRNLFDDVANRKMYVTGGIGSSSNGEAFTVSYDLPNGQAYAETCASIGLMFFADRMFRADPDKPSKYHDILELAMYNGALSGLSLHGDEFFYENPLEIYLRDHHRHTDGPQDRFPITQRVKLFFCSCCPPNIVRVYSSLEKYFYTYDRKIDAVYVHHFGNSRFASGDVSVTQSTAYPCDGKITITSNKQVLVRIPGWCRHFTANQPYTEKNGYALFAPGSVTVDLHMEPELITSSVQVVRNIGKAALRRGPFIYCAEGVDHDGDVQTLFFDTAALSSAVIRRDDTLKEDVIELDGWRIKDQTDALYHPLSDRFEKVKLTMIPYHAFANRGETDMLVFLGYR